MRSPQNFNSLRVHRSRFEHGALGLVSIISLSFELRIAHHFFLWTPCSSRNILSKFQIFFLIDSTGPQSFSSVRVHWSMSEFGALWLLSIISLSSKLRIVHHFFLWNPCFSRNILSNFQIFSQPARPIGNRFIRFVGLTCIEH